MQKSIIIKAKEIEKEYKKKKGNIYLLTRTNGLTPVARESRIV